MTDQPDSKNQPGGSSPYLKVAAVFLGGIAVNLLSDQLQVSPPIVLMIAALGLILVLAAERSTSVEISLDRESLALTKFALASLLLGASVGALWVLPVWHARRLVTPWGPFFYNYEVGAASVLVVVACISAIRRRDPVLWLTFLGSGIAGMTLAIVYLKGDADFFLTFAGWLIYGVVATFLVSGAPELATMFAAFLGFQQRDASIRAPQTKQPHQQYAHNVRPPSPIVGPQRDDPVLQADVRGRQPERDVGAGELLDAPSREDR